MFGLVDLLALIISAFIILPVVILLRELGYIIVGAIFGAKNPRLTLGSGPRLFKFGVLDVRKQYHLYSWFSVDDLKYNGNFAYICLYAGPILINVISGLTVNGLLANGYMEDMSTFWNRFVFYTFYYVLFDTIPMRTLNRMPNNGMIIYELIRHGKRVDYNKNFFLPETTDVEGDYQEGSEEINEMLEKKKEEEEQVKGKKERDRRQAERDRKQKDRDIRQRERENRQKGRESEQEGRESEQGERDNRQAERDRKQKERDRRQAERDREQEEEELETGKRNT